MRLRERDPDPVDPEGNLGGNMLQVPSLFHREAETDRLGRAGGALPEEIRPEEPEVRLGVIPLKGAKASGIQGGGRRRLDSPPWPPDPLALFFTAGEIIKNFTAEHAETAEFKPTKNGKMELWDDGRVGNAMSFPIFHHSNFPVFLSACSVLLFCRVFKFY